MSGERASGVGQNGTRSQGPGSGGPARGYRWETFRAGNLAHLDHGARSPRVFGSLAEHLAAGLVADRPDLDAYPESVAAWATAEAQAALLRRHVAEVGPIGEDGEPRKGVLGWLRTYERLAREARQPLGLDPLSEARLSRERAEAATLAVDLDGLAERGRRALAEREAAGLPAPPDLAGDVLAAARGARTDHHEEPST